MEIVCLDMEGTLTPEIWQQVSINTGIKDFAKTTRDIPSYSDLMDERIKIMRDHKISLKDIQFAASQLELLEGAKDFLDRIREKFQVVILSDNFHEIASPLMAKLGFPFLLCHTLKVENGIIVDYELRQDKAKQKAILAFQNLGYRCFAAGDSFNDIQMFDVCEKGFFINAPEKVSSKHPEIYLTKNYLELEKCFLANSIFQHE